MLVSMLVGRGTNTLRIHKVTTFIYSELGVWALGTTPMYTLRAHHVWDSPLEGEVGHEMETSQALLFKGKKRAPMPQLNIHTQEQNIGISFHC